MFRLTFALWLIVAPSLLGIARADDIPVIVTYEMQKQQRQARQMARNPRGFWIKQVAARLELKAATLQSPLKEPVTVHVSFVVAHDGHLVSKQIAPSGNEVVDKAALAMLDRAQPFPPMPEAMRDTELAFSLPVRFR